VLNLVVEELGLVPYQQAYDRQTALVEQLHGQPAGEDRCLVLEHPAVFTLGRNGKTEHVGVAEPFLAERGIELIRVERGGEVTYHGPGQLVCYPIVNLRRSGFSVADFVFRLEQAMLDVAVACGVQATRDRRNHGIWCGNRKLGSVGIAIRHGITYHGLALNVDLDLTPFGWINPCGLKEVSMTSLAQELGQPIDREQVRGLLIAALGQALQHQITSPDDARQTIAPGLQPRVERLAKPKWLKKRLPSGPEYERTRRLVRAGSLHTVCQEARCPNQFECYGKGTATFMIMGDKCTRNCRFCAVSHAAADPLDIDEPARVAAAVNDMALDYVVLTSVTRDDLTDGGASHFAATIDAIRTVRPATRVEILIPDLQGNRGAIERLCGHNPAVINHNIETVRRLYPRVRPQADYERSLALLEQVKQCNPGIVTKSGLMVGLGETLAELRETLVDIRRSGCDLLTVGQYLQPTAGHLPVERFVTPDEFEQIHDLGMELGFAAVAAGPHVRSSYRAAQLFQQAAAINAT